MNDSLVRITSILRLVGRPVLNGPRDVGNFTGARLWVRPLHEPVQRVPRRSASGARAETPHYMVCLVCLWNKLANFGVDLCSWDDRTSTLPTGLTDGDAQQQLLACAYPFRTDDTSAANHHMKDKHNNLTTRSCHLEKLYIAWKTKPSTAVTAIAKAFALGQPRTCGEAFTLNDKAIIAMRQAIAISSSVTRLPLDFFQQPIILDVLHAYARRDLAEVRGCTTDRRGMKSLITALHKSFCEIQWIKMLLLQ